MSTETAPDRVAAYLTEVRERACDEIQDVPSGPEAAGLWSCQDVPRLLAAVEKVLELHQPEPGGLPSSPGARVCGMCAVAWPCREYEVISRALLGTNEMAGHGLSGTEGEAMSTETETLAERITSVLVANGFIEYDPRAEAAGYPTFAVAEGVGATVGLSWAAAEAERAAMLAKYENRLRTAGLKVENRGDHLYVAGCPDHPEGVRG